jgi:hypothetical protein
MAWIRNTDQKNDGGPTHLRPAVPGVRDTAPPLVVYCFHIAHRLEERTQAAYNVSHLSLFSQKLTTKTRK